MTHDDFLNAAAVIGRRLVRQAMWDGNRCTWEIKTSDRSSPDVRRVQTEQASGTVYQGTAGIAWFLAALGVAAGDDDLEKTAEGALSHALSDATELPHNNFAFHSGPVGIAWVATQMARTLGRDEYLEHAWNLLAPLAGNEHQDQGIDVIGGAAGAIPALLEIGYRLDRDEPAAMARRLGDRLIHKAHREPDGWSWPTVGGSAARNLNGLAHGASGFGLALLELFYATGEGAYRFAAEMAFLYERQFFDPETSNWPDLRHKAVSDPMYYGLHDELRQAAKAGVVPKYRLSYMAAWCHGSPGVGLARLRAYELTSQSLYRQELEAAMVSTMASIAEERLRIDNYSLCHGIGGNCELPLLAAELLDEPEWRQPCERAAEVGLARFEQAGLPWACGTLGATLDPCLLLGEAGIGFFLLRLAVPDVPSILLLRPRHEHARAAEKPEAEGFESLARQSAEGFFDTTLRIVDRLAAEPLRLSSMAPAETPLERSPAATVYEDLQRWATAQPDASRTRFQDAFQVDRLRFELSRQPAHFTDEFLRELIRPAVEAVDWTEGRFSLAPGGRLVSQHRDWQSWLEEDDPSAVPEPEETIVLLYLKDNQMHSQPVGPLAALVLSAVQSTVTLAEIVEQIAAALDGGADLDRDALASKVLPQLQQLYQAGFVDSSEPSSKPQD